MHPIDLVNKQGWLAQILSQRWKYKRYWKCSYSCCGRHLDLNYLSLPIPAPLSKWLTLRCSSCANPFVDSMFPWNNINIVNTCYSAQQEPNIVEYTMGKHINLFPLIPACTARPGLPLSPPETAFLESPYYRPQTALIADRHRPTNFHSVTYTQTDDAAFEAGSDNDHKSFLRMRVIFKVEYPAELFRFRRVLDDILSSFDVF